MDPNGSSHSSWGSAVLTDEETCKRKGQAHGVKDYRQPAFFNPNTTPANNETAQTGPCCLCRKVRDTRASQGFNTTCFSRSPK